MLATVSLRRLAGRSSHPVTATRRLQRAAWSPRGAEASGIVSFRVGDEDPARTAARLRGRGVFVVDRRGGVRASPHFYNSEDDLERLLSSL